MRKALERLALSPWSYTVLAVGAILSSTLGMASGNKVILPLLNVLSAYPIFIGNISAGKSGRAFGLMLFWAVLMTAVITANTILGPDICRDAIFNGQSYWDEMHKWIQTGVGSEGSPRLFLPVHLKHFALFVVLTVATCGAASLLFGTLLLNHMNLYYGMALSHATNRATVALFGWPIWAIARVAGYIAVASGLTGMVVSKLRRQKTTQTDQTLVILGVGLVILDVILKAILADFWQGVLNGAVR